MKAKITIQFEIEDVQDLYKDEQEKLSKKQMLEKLMETLEDKETLVWYLPDYDYKVSVK